MTLWIKVPIIIIAVFAIFITVTSFVGEYRRQLEKAALIEKLVNESPTERLLKVDYASLKDLPKPVQKYSRYVLTDGQSFIKTTWLEQIGKLKVTPKSNDWSSFKAPLIRRPAFCHR